MWWWLYKANISEDAVFHDLVLFVYFCESITNFILERSFTHTVLKLNRRK
jgi:hypothetical protein